MSGLARSPPECWPWHGLAAVVTTPGAGPLDAERGLTRALLRQLSTSRRDLQPSAIFQPRLRARRSWDYSATARPRPN